MAVRFKTCTEPARSIWNSEGVFFSKKFCEYFSDNFENIFVKGTGIKPSYKVTLAGFKQRNERPMYEEGEVSRLNVVIWVMPSTYFNISFCWQSKSEKIVHTTDEDFNEEDLDCWLEGVDPVALWKAVATEQKEHPFHIKELPYDLKVLGFGTEMTVIIDTRDDSGIDNIAEQLSSAIYEYNDKSEQKDRKDGLVHNHRTNVADNKIELRIDTGSAGVLIIKKLLKILAKQTNVKEVILDL